MDKKTGNFGNNLTLEHTKSKIILTSEIPFSKRCVPCVNYTVDDYWPLRIWLGLGYGYGD